MINSKPHKSIVANSVTGCPLVSELVSRGPLRQLRSSRGWGCSHPSLIFSIIPVSHASGCLEEWGQPGPLSGHVASPQGWHRLPHSMAAGFPQSDSSERQTGKLQVSWGSASEVTEFLCHILRQKVSPRAGQIQGAMGGMREQIRGSMVHRKNICGD